MRFIKIKNKQLQQHNMFYSHGFAVMQHLFAQLNAESKNYE